MKTSFRWRPIGALLTALTLSGSAVHATAVAVTPGLVELQLSRILREAATPVPTPPNTRLVVRGVTDHASGLRAQYVSYPSIGTVLINTPAVHQHPELKTAAK